MLALIGYADIKAPWWPVTEHLLHGPLVVVVQDILDSLFFATVEFHVVVRRQLGEVRVAVDENVKLRRGEHKIDSHVPRFTVRL